jgi:hypothetical protein
VIGTRIIEVDGAFDQPEAKHPRVEIEVALRIARDRGDMMNAADAGHATPQMANLLPLRKSTASSAPAGAV